MKPSMFAFTAVSLLAPLAMAQPAPPEVIYGNVTNLNCQGAHSTAFAGFTVYAFGFADLVKSPSSGAGIAGRPLFPDISVTKGLDDCTPLLFGAVAKATRFPKVTLTVAAGSPLPLLLVTLQDVIITSERFTEDGADGNARDLDEVVTMSYGRISIESGGQTFRWDVQKNGPF